MRLTGEPTDAALMSGRKRSIHDLEAAYVSARHASRPATRVLASASASPSAAPSSAAARAASPLANKMRVDQDLLVQVLRAQLQAMIRDLRAHVRAQATGNGAGAGLDREQSLLAELEGLAGNLEQDWVVALLSSDKPQYGFPDVLAALKARMKAKRRAAGPRRDAERAC